MDRLDAVNPYRAPEASIAALRAEIRRPPVFTAISLLCWATAAFHLAGCVLMIGVTVRHGLESGWEWALGPSAPLVLSIFALGLLAAACYVVAGRWLRDNRGRPGLILCGFAVGVTYLILWLINRP